MLLVEEVVTASTLLFPVSLLIGCRDWVQGGNPLYAAVKCLSGCWGQFWRNFSIFFAKSTRHTHFLTGKFFSETKNNFFPPKLAVFRGSRHFSEIEGPFSEIEGPEAHLYVAHLYVPPTTRTLNFWKRTLNFWNLTGSTPGSVSYTHLTLPTIRLV